LLVPIPLLYRICPNLLDALDLFQLPYASPSKVGCFPVAVQRIFAVYFRQSDTSFLIFAFIHFKAERIRSSICFMFPLALSVVNRTNGMVPPQGISLWYFPQGGVFPQLNYLVKRCCDPVLVKFDNLCGIFF
jgi:hypothetical protein